MISSRTADIIIESLRAGEVPQEGLEHFAIGLDVLGAALEREFPRIEERRGRYRFIRGDYGTGKTFFLRYLSARARALGFVSTYVRVSYPELPLHQPIAIYRALVSGLGKGDKTDGALKDLVEQWLFTIGERVSDPGIGKGISDEDPRFPDAVADEVRVALGPIAEAAPAMAQGLAAYARASLNGEHDIARGLLQWIGGDEKVAAQIKKKALQTGKLANLDSLPMLRALSELIRQSGYRGLVVLLDEAERLTRVNRLDQRTSGLQTLQNWIGALDSGQLPGVLFVVAGTSTFFTSPRGVPLLPPLQQRIGTIDDSGFPDLDAVLVSLPPFDRDRLLEAGKRVRQVFETLHPGASLKCDDTFLEGLVSVLTEAFHGHVEVTPRRFLRELVSVLSRVRQYADYEPARQYTFDGRTGAEGLAPAERLALEGGDVRSADTLDLPAEIDL